jgi:hypothetical protein
VKWKNPITNGSPITHYILTYRDGEIGNFEKPIKIEMLPLRRDKEGYYDYLVKVFDLCDLSESNNI